jgi:hypothetical protein
VESPLDPLRVQITDAPLLRLDAQGGLHLRLSVSDPLEALKGGKRNVEHQKWAIDFLELEVSGRTQ